MLVADIYTQNEPGYKVSSNIVKYPLQLNTDLTLDLNGHIIDDTLDSVHIPEGEAHLKAPVRIVYGNVELKNGTIQSAGTLAVLSVSPFAEVTLTDVTLSGTAPDEIHYCEQTTGIVTAPTCTTEGFTGYGCTLCGDDYVTDRISATGHSYETVTIAATCTQNGEIKRTCSVCGDVMKETIPAVGHSYNGVVVSPTCTEIGYTGYTCIDCGDSYVDDVVPAAGHNYADGYCIVCGEEGSVIVVPTLTLKNPTLAFEDEILYNVYFDVSDMSSVVEMGMITFATRNENGTVADALEVIPGYVSNSDGSYTVHSNGVPAKMLGDALYFKAYAKLANGTYVYTAIAGYHAVLYANTILNSSAASAQAKSLVVAMLNYGAAAQVSFEYKTDSLMNANLTSAQKALVSAYSESMIAAVPSVSTTKAGSFVNNGGYSDLHPTVSFEGAFSINYYFTPKYTPDNSTITFYYWNLSDFNANSVLKTTNATGSVKMTSTDGVYTAAVEGIAAKAIDEPVFIAAVYTNGGTSYYTPVIGYSLGAYCKNLAANGNDFGAATAVYGYYAKAYFAS